MGDLVSGAVVGAVVGEALKYPIEAFNRGRKYPSTLERGRKTCNALAPLVEEIIICNDSLGRPSEDTEIVETITGELTDLVRKSKKPTFKNCLSCPAQQEKLQKKLDALHWHSSVVVPFENKRDLMKLLVLAEKIHGNQIRFLCGAPQVPEFTGRLDLFTELKIELLKYGVSVFLLTGLGASVKPTLQMNLSWDPQIQAKFRGNIFVVTVSRTPNLKYIVQTLFARCGLWMPEFQSDEDAINELGLLFWKISIYPILLILDDVWPGSESLVDKFRFQLPDYKILYFLTETKPFSTPSHSSGNYFVAQDGGNDIMTRNNFVAQDGGNNIMTCNNFVAQNDGNDMLKDIVPRRRKKLSTSILVLWRRKKLGTIVLIAATATWVSMEVYQFNFLTLISWLTIFVVTSIFLYSNMLTFFGKEPPNLLRLELKEETTLRMAKTVRAWIEKSIRWLFVVSIKKDWPVFVGVMATLFVISYVGTCMDFLTFIYIGIVAGMTLPVNKKRG